MITQEKWNMSNGFFPIFNSGYDKYINPQRQNASSLKYSIKVILLKEKKAASVVSIDELNEDLRFKRCMDFSYSQKGDTYCIEYKRGNDVLVYVEENSFEEMKEELKNEFISLWYEIAKEDDDALSEGAKQTKKWLLDNIEEVN